MKKTKNLLTTLLGFMLIVCVAFTTLSLSKTSKAKAEDESDVYLFETDGGGVLTSAPIAFETALSGGAANAKLFMEFGLFEDVSFGSTQIYFGFGDATPGASDWGLMTSSNTMCFGRENTETAENNFRVFKGYPNTYAWKSDNDATYAPYSALFAEGVKIQFEVDIYAGAIQQYFLKVWDSVNEEYVSINDAWLTGETLDAGDITNWCIYLQVNDVVSMKITDPKFYAIDGETTKNLEILKSSSVTKLEEYDPYTVKHTVSFKNGETDVTSLSVDDLANIKYPDIPDGPEVSGKIFKYWALDGEEFSFSTPITEDITLDAVYRDNTGKTGISAIAFQSFGGGEYAYSVRFDTYIPQSASVSTNTDLSTGEYVMVAPYVDGVEGEAHKENRGGGYIAPSLQAYYNDTDRENGFIGKMFGYQLYLGDASFVGSDQVVITLKEGATVGIYGEKLDKDYKFIATRNADHNAVTFVELNKVNKVEVNNGKLEVSFDWFVAEAVKTNVVANLTLNGEIISGDAVAFDYGKVANKISIDMTQLDLNDINTFVVTKSDKNVNQNAAAAAIHTINRIDSVVCEDYTCYLAKEGDVYVVYTDGDHVYGVFGETTKAEYTLGEDFDLTTVTANELKVNGTKTPVDLTGATVSDYDKDTLGEQTVTITLADERTFTLDVVVNDIVVGITASTTKSTYNYGEDLDLTTFTAKETLQQTGEGETVEISEITGYDKNTLGAQTLTVKYGDFTATVVITVVDYVADYQVVCTKDKVYVKEALTKDDFEVTEVMASGANGQKVTVTGIVGFNANTLGQQTVVVSFGENSKEVVVTVIDKATGIEVASQITEVEFGAELDLSKISVKYVMASGADGEAVAITKDNIEGYDASKAGVQTVTVKVGDFTATFGVQVNEEVKATGCKSSIEYSSVSLIVLALCIVYVLRKKKTN